MTPREHQALALVLEEVRATTETLASDMADIKALLASRAPAPTNGRGPKWLDFVRFGGKPCAGGCATIIPSGPGRAWYEPATAGRKAAVFCEPCGNARQPAP